MLQIDTSSPIVIFGIGREGRSTYRALKKFFPSASITLVDDKDIQENNSEWTQTLAEDQENTRFVLAKDFSFPEGPGTLFKTPGIAPSHPLLAAVPQGWTVTSNIALAMDMFHAHDCFITIGVTGTKGKSTATSAVYHVLKSSGKKTHLAGNIGVPALDIVQSLFSQDGTPLSNEKQYIVIEFSSHQLLSVTKSPQIGVLLDITPEHLDYYRSFEEYSNAKNNIAAFQKPSDIFLYSPTTKEARRIAELSPAKQFTLGFSLNINESKYTVTATSDALYFKNEKIITSKEINVVGSHTYLNLLPAVAIAKLLSISNDDIQKALKTFRPLPHRLEFVATIDGVSYYNDSQGTTPEAQKAALEAFPDKTIILLAGGSDKGIDMMPVAEQILDHQVSAVFLFPPTGLDIAEKITKLSENQSVVPPEITHVSSMSEAVKKASLLAKSGDVVLLAPACASFGLFRDYQDRGNQFKDAVLNLQK